MDHMEGTTLADWLGDHDMPISTVLVLFSGIVRGMLGAPNQHIIHRCLCRTTVLVNRDSIRLGVIDFGMSKEIPPILDEDMSISLMFLVGVGPFPTDDPVEARSLRLLSTDEPIEVHRADIPGDLKNIIKRLLMTEPEDRLKDCSTLTRMRHVHANAARHERASVALP
jgi:hypothetical protein